MRTKIIFILLSFFFILLSAGLGAAWSDDCERYPNSALTDVWTPSGGCSLVQYPTNYQTSHSIQLTETTGTVSGNAASSSITSNNAVYDGYFSFVVRSRYAYLQTNQDPESRITAYLISDEGVTVATCNFISTVADYDISTPLFCELITIGNNVYGYVNGVSIGDVGDIVGGHSYHVKIQSYVMNRDNYVPSYATIRLDDFSTSSIIGTTPNYAETSSQIEASYTIQAYDSYPDRTYIIDLYSLTAGNAGIISSFDVSGQGSTGFITYDINNLNTNFGLYLLELTKDNIIIADTYIYYSSISDAGTIPNVLFSASSNVGMEIRDADNNGGIISGGGAKYLYPDNDSGIYPIYFTLQDVPYSFTATLNAIYGNELINSTPFYFSGLNNNYVVSVDGKSLAGEKASGSLSFSGNAADGETVSIGSDTYEFDSGDGVTENHIPVPIGENASVSGENLAQEINSNGTESVSASTEEGIGEYYYSDISIQNNPNIADYQAKVTIPFETWMSSDFRNIRFFDGETSIPYWIESKTDSDSAVVWIPINEGSDIQCRWGIEGESESESSISNVMVFGDDFSESSLSASNFNLIAGTANIVNGELVLSSSGRIFSHNPFDTNSNKIMFKHKVADSSINRLYEPYCGISNSVDINTARQAGFGININPVLAVVHQGENWAYPTIPNVAKNNNYYVTEIRKVGSTAYITSTDSNAVTGSVSSTSYMDTSESNYIYLSSGTTTFTLDYVCVRKYAATEPTLSTGSAQTTTGGLIFLHVIADQIGSAQNSIETSETCTNAAWESSTLIGGDDGSFILGSSWNYTITDWTDLTTHIFSFSPDLTKPGVYGYIKDTATQTPIKSATVTISNNSSTQYVYTDSTGLYYLTEGMALGETYSVTAAKTGYTQSASFNAKTVAGATTRKDLFMDSLSSGSGIYYAAHDVTFTVLEYWYSAVGLPGVSYSVYDNSSELLKSGTTGSKGTFSVKDMDQGVKYTIVLTYNGNTYTEYIEPGLTEYNLVLNKEGIVHEYYNNWLTLSYVETPGNVSVLFNSNKTITAASLTVTASNGTIVQADTLNSTSGTFSFNFTDGDYILQFNIEASDGSAASQIWAISYPSQVTLFPASYPAWLKNVLFVAIITIFLLAFGKSKNDIACGSVAVLTSLGYYFEWLTCSFNFVVLIWIIALGAIFLHYKRTGAVG